MSVHLGHICPYFSFIVSNTVVVVCLPPKGGRDITAVTTATTAFHSRRRKSTNYVQVRLIVNCLAVAVVPVKKQCSIVYVGGIVHHECVCYVSR